MDQNLLLKKKDALNRRDFLKLMSVTAGAVSSAWMLSGCGSQPKIGETPTVAIQRYSSPTASKTPTAGKTITPTDTATITQATEGVYLPQVDGTFSSYPLPEPQPEGWQSLLQAFQERHSTHSFSADELPVQSLADLLWAGFGVNRPQSGGRTAPSAYDARDITIYLATGKGLYRYEAENHTLTVVLPDDLRPFTGTQAFVADAPVNFVYVSDYRKLALASAQDRERWSWAHSGCIAQNVYLCCASWGLATVVRSSLERDTLKVRMKLDDSQHITLAQTIGYPAAL